MKTKFIAGDTVTHKGNKKEYIVLDVKKPNLVDDLINIFDDTPKPDLLCKHVKSGEIGKLYSAEVEK